MAPRRSGRPFPQGARGITTPGMAQSEEFSPPNNQQQNLSSTVDTSSREDTTASLKRTTLAMAAKVMRREETSVFLGDLVKLHLGTKEVEGFVRKQEKLRRAKDGVSERYEDDSGMRERERVLVGNAMENKLTSSLTKGVKMQQEFFALKNKLWWRMKKDEDRLKFRNKMREVVERERKPDQEGPQEASQEHQDGFQEGVGDEPTNGVEEVQGCQDLWEGCQQGVQARGHGGACDSGSGGELAGWGRDCHPGERP